MLEGAGHPLHMETAVEVKRLIDGFIGG